MSIVIVPSPDTHPSGVLTCFRCKGEGKLHDFANYTVFSYPCPECKRPIVKKEPDGGPTASSTDTTDSGGA